MAAQQTEGQEVLFSAQFPWTRYNAACSVAPTINNDQSVTSAKTLCVISLPQLTSYKLPVII